MRLRILKKIRYKLDGFVDTKLFKPKEVIIRYDSSDLIYSFRLFSLICVVVQCHSREILKSNFVNRVLLVPY